MIQSESVAFLFALYHLFQLIPATILACRRRISALATGWCYPWKMLWLLTMCLYCVLFFYVDFHQRRLHPVFG